jgi:phosphatidate cytidylyltransferase
MAFNLAIFKTRALSAIIFAAIMIGGLVYNQWTFLALFAVINFGCWWEFHRLMEKIEPTYKDLPNLLRYTIMLIGFAYMLYMSNPFMYPIGKWNLHDLGGYFLIAMASLFLVGLVLFYKKITFNNVLSLVAGFLYISLSWGLMIKLRGRVNPYEQVDAGWLIPVILIASIWVNDTMAYIMGSLFGKRPLSSISPKKTWEGTISGVILAVLVVSYGGHALFSLPFRLLILVSFLSSVMGTLGDLFESKLKRLADVKDSGSMMPGHGGFLDRFDSLLIATPYVWLFADMFLQ